MVKIYSHDGMVLMIVGDCVCKVHDGDGWQQPWWRCVNNIVIKSGIRG